MMIDFQGVILPTICFQMVSGHRCSYSAGAGNGKAKPPGKLACISPISEDDPVVSPPPVPTQTTEPNDWFYAIVVVEKIQPVLVKALTKEK